METLPAAAAGQEVPGHRPARPPTARGSTSTCARPRVTGVTTVRRQHAADRHRDHRIEVPVMKRPRQRAAGCKAADRGVRSSGRCGTQPVAVGASGCWCSPCRPDRLQRRRAAGDRRRHHATRRTSPRPRASSTGDEVRVAGVKVGKVTGVALDGARSRSPSGSGRLDRRRQHRRHQHQDPARREVPGARPARQPEQDPGTPHPARAAPPRRTT